MYVLRRRRTFPTVWTHFRFRREAEISVRTQGPARRDPLVLTSTEESSCNIVTLCETKFVAEKEISSMIYCDKVQLTNLETIGKLMTYQLTNLP